MQKVVVDQPIGSGSVPSHSGKDVRWLAASVTVVFFLLGGGALALQLDELPADREWHTRSIEISGNRSIGGDDLREAILTKTRAWYAPWRDRPPFDPVTFAHDLDRMRRSYDMQGYYNAKITYELTLDEDAGLVSAVIHIDEGSPVRFAEIDVRVATGEVPRRGALGKTFPAEGDVFIEKDYVHGEAALRTFFLDRGHAHVTTTRRARVDPAARDASVEYTAEPGVIARFGETRIEGLEKVDEDIVLRELSYEPGDRFDAGALRASRQRILALDLFAAVQITPLLDNPDPSVVPIRIDVEESPPRDVRIGVGYGTDEGPRGQFQWGHRNWLGDGRQLTLSVKGSEIANEAAATFVQPYLLSSARNRGVVRFALFNENEDTYNRSGTHLIPRFERILMPRLTGFVGYRIEYDDLSDVDDETIATIGGFEPRGVLTGPVVGLTWDSSNDHFNPSSGEVVSLEFLQAGGLWGGTYTFWRGTLQVKKYVSIPWETVLAGRVKLGLADAIGPIENLPLFERFYAGGANSVRGYARRRLGPLSQEKQEAVGGRSLFEGSIELRRAIRGKLGGALFLDFGQVSLAAFDPPITDVKFAAGPGITYDTPIGPLRLDVGFPFDPPPGDASWQLHFSIGQFF
jgi:outer membrane protein assembly complex protein YaeT